MCVNLCLSLAPSDGLVQVFSSSGSVLGWFGDEGGEDAGAGRVSGGSGGLGRAIAGMVFLPTQKGDPDSV